MEGFVAEYYEGEGGSKKQQNWNYVLDWGLGTFLAERAMEASYLKKAFHESHIIGHWCYIGPQNFLI